VIWDIPIFRGGYPERQLPPEADIAGEANAPLDVKGWWLAAVRLPGTHEKRLALLDDISCQFDAGDCPKIARRVDHTSRDEIGISSFKSYGLLPLYLKLERAFWHVDQLLTRVTMPRRHHARREIHPRLNRFMAYYRQIMPLKIGPLQARRWRLGQRYRARADNYGHDDSNDTIHSASGANDRFCDPR
jgi:hypothetical protein